MILLRFNGYTESHATFAYCMNIFSAFEKINILHLNFYCRAFLRALNSTKSSGKIRSFIAYQKFIPRDFS